MKRTIIFWPIGILIAGFLIMSLLMSLRKEPPKPLPKTQAKIVQAKLVTMQETQAQIIGYGRLKSAQPVILYSEVNGTLVEGNIPFQPAQSFKKGDLLLKIDDRPIRLDINSAKSDFLNALASVLPEIKVDFPGEYEVWQQYFNECSFNKKLEPLPETTNQKIKLFLSRFNVYKLFFQVSNLEIQLEKHFFYAPFNGSIISADLRVGSTARNGIRLGEIINLNEMEVEVPIPATDIQWIDQKKDVELSSTEISGQWLGKIKRIGQNIDTQTQTISVYIAIKDPHQDILFNGVFLKAIIPGKIIKNAFVVPRRLIYDDRYVYLVNQGIFEQRPVTVSRTELDSALVTSGIQNGDTLVVEVLQGVAEGMLAKAQLE